jgi:hypothetical protein
MDAPSTLAPILHGVSVETLETIRLPGSQIEMKSGSILMMVFHASSRTSM